MTQENALPEGVAALWRLLDEGFAGGRLEVVDELCSPDLIENQFGLAATGAEALDNLRRAISEVRAMAPDISYRLEDWAQRGDVVWARVTATGTQTGPFFGAPSGRPFEITVVDVFRFRDGLVVEHWGVPDRFALLAQTGALHRLSA